MRKIDYRSYIVLLGIFFILFSFSPDTSLTLRQMSISAFSCFWDRIYVLTHPLNLSTSTSAKLEIETLRQDNYLLRLQVDHIREWLLSEDRIHEQMDLLKSMNNVNSQESEKLFLQRRCQETIKVLQLKSRAIPAKVIFREPGSWNNYVWINVGEADNEYLQEVAIAKNSPVLIGNSVVGVIDLVHKTRSRVRLITDNRLTIAVRAARGKQQDHLLLEQLNTLVFSLEKSANSTCSQEMQEAISALTRLKAQFIPVDQNMYLAKGELQGTGRPLWRSCGSFLKGTGFNYDFSDEEGPARDLRSGFTYEKDPRLPSVALLRVGDLLITTGLDGIFPAGLHVGVVSKVDILQEGQCFYHLEAMATAGSFDELNFVCVLPVLK
ncbi:MAG: rod shape-determining protein MreC [Chlamydiae bacterium]|nr:MAG: rod shape-determining protein MreC [Chlamydiota bacterium]